MAHISTSNYLLESIIDDFQSIATEFEEIGKNVVELSEKLDITNKYDRNMINFIKVSFFDDIEKFGRENVRF
jgi:hypothetical protein